MVEWIKSKFSIGQVLGTVLTILSILAIITAFAADAGSTKQRVTTLEKQIDLKADKKDVEYLIKTIDEMKKDNKEQLDRIENKLDKHIAK